MKFRDFGLLTGLTIGGGLIVAGLSTAPLADSNSPGSGIMLVIGTFFAISGLFILASTLLGWVAKTFFAKAGVRGRTVLLWVVALCAPTWLGSTG